MLGNSEFSKKYLQKYGWEEGQGLGKTKDGIKDAIKPKLKFDKAGIGFDPALEFTDNWWEKVYSDALKDKTASEEKDEKRKKLKKKVEVKKDSQDPDYLYKACEGRTAHKGARHGMQLSGKLLRLESQEKELLRKHATMDWGKCEETSTVEKCDLRECFVEDIKTDKKYLKTGRKKRKHDFKISESDHLSQNPLTNNNNLVHRKKKKKMRGQ